MRANNVVLNDKLEDVSISKAYSFPFEVSFSEIRKLSKGYVKLHWHDEIQISIVTKGSVEFIVGEKSYILKIVKIISKKDYLLKKILLKLWGVKKIFLFIFSKK